MTMGPNPGTEPSMAKVGWTVQSAFYDRNSHAVRESVPSLCREAAQSNMLAPPNAATTSLFQCGRHWRGIGEPERWARLFAVHEL